MVNEAGDPDVPPGERDQPVHDQWVTSATAPVANDADDVVTVRPMIAPDGDRDREVERAELGERAPLSEAQANDRHREHQHRFDLWGAKWA
jgi:hypothetical protein